MKAEREISRPRCPACGGPLVGIGSPEISISGENDRRRHACWCPAGCRGPEADGTFEFIECPACGAHDTVSTPRGRGVEEVACNACGAITSLQIRPSADSVTII